MEENCDENLPEIHRIKVFMKKLEDELFLTDDMSQSISFIEKETDSDDGFASECEKDPLDTSFYYETEFEHNSDILFDDSIFNASSITQTPQRKKLNIDTTFHDVYNLNTPTKVPSLVDIIKQETPNSKIDVFFDILQRSGYHYDVATHTTRHIPFSLCNADENSQLSEICQEYFFSSPDSAVRQHSPLVQSSNTNNSTDNARIDSNIQTLDSLLTTGNNKQDDHDNNNSNSSMHTVDIHHTPNNNTSTSTTGSVPSNKKDIDLRLQGDFSIWHAGKKCTVYGIKEAYIGLYETVLSHHLENGILIHATHANIHKELTTMNNNSTHSNSTHGSMHSTPTRLHTLRSSSPTSTTIGTTIGGNNGYYSVHVMECVIRPDVLLNTIITSVVKVAQASGNYKITTAQRSQIVLTTIKPRRSSFENLKQAATHSSSDLLYNTTEFDLVDIQVCISKELRQRVLLVQFFKKVPMLKVNTLGGLILNSLTGSVITLKPLKECPVTKKFVHQLKRELTSSNLSLSSLYTSSLRTVCSLPTGLDTHFKAQLHTLVRDHMWQKLETDYKYMEDHVVEQETECVAFCKTMEFIYKQYNLPMPPPWTRSRITSTQDSGGNLQTSNQIGTFHHASGNHSPVFVAESDLPASPIRIRSYSDMDENNSDEGDTYGHHTTSAGIAAMTMSPIDEVSPNDEKEERGDYKKSNSVSELVASSGTSQDDFLEIKTVSNDVIPVHTTPNVKKTTAVDSSESDQLTSSQHPPTLATPPATSTATKVSRKRDGKDLVYSNADSGNNSSYIEELMLMKKVDGMTFCLVMLDKCYQELQRECDGEYSVRMQHRNLSTVRLIDDILDYKQQLLQNIVNIPDVQNTPPMKTFATTFLNIPVTTSTAMHNELSAPQPGGNKGLAGEATKTLHATKSWFVGHVSNYLSHTVATAGVSVPGTEGKKLAIENGVAKSTQSESNTTNSQHSRSMFNLHANTAQNSSTTNSAGGGGWSSLWGGGKKTTTLAPEVGHVYKPTPQNRQQLSKPANTPSNEAIVKSPVGTELQPVNSLHTSASVVFDDNNSDSSKSHNAYEEEINTATSSTTVSAKDIQGGVDLDDATLQSGTSTSVPSSVKVNIMTNPIVLYYCTCVVSNIPATIYITTSTIAIAYSNMLGSILHYTAGPNSVQIARSGREVYALSSILDISLPTVVGANMLTSNMLRIVLSFGTIPATETATSTGVNGAQNAQDTLATQDDSSSNISIKSSKEDTKELCISPVAIDCLRLKAIISEAMRLFQFAGK